MFQLEARVLQATSFVSEGLLDLEGQLSLKRLLELAYSTYGLGYYELDRVKKRIELIIQ